MAAYVCLHRTKKKLFEMSIHYDLKDIANEATEKQSKEEEIEKLIAALSEAQKPKIKDSCSKGTLRDWSIAITRLISMLSQAGWEVRSSAFLALAEVGKPATHAFQAALHDNDWFGTERQQQNR